MKQQLKQTSTTPNASLNGLIVRHIINFTDMTKKEFHGMREDPLLENGPSVQTKSTACCFTRY